jgi:hypothetical protein
MQSPSKSQCHSSQKQENQPYTLYGIIPQVTKWQPQLKEQCFRIQSCSNNNMVLAQKQVKR